MTRNRYRILSVVLLFLLIISIGKVYAQDHKLESLDIDVYINQDGSAIIKEKRKAVLSSGTENFIVIENLGKSKITNFTVYENGDKYKFIDNWDINWSRESKKNKNGIIKTSNGYELSWGIGEYGSHEYNLEYTVTNFVKQLEDSQMIFWKFVNEGTNIPPENVKISIFSDNEFNEENEKIWGFGFSGNVEFDNGKIVANNNNPLSSNDYITILIQLPQGIFQTEDIINKSFEEIKNTAFVGSDYNGEINEEGVYPGSGVQENKDFFSIFGTFIIPIIGIIILIFSKILSRNKSNSNYNYPTKFKKQYKEEYYRDYPYEGEFLDIYYIPYIMGTTDFEKLLTGFILKWINENRIITVEEEVGWLFKKDSTNLKFLNKETLDNHLEDELFKMMLTAAGENEILEEKEFTKWARSNLTRIDSWEKEVKEYSIGKLQKLGYLDIIEKKFLFFKIPNYELTIKGKEFEANVYKYINYLYDFSLLNEHEAINVKIWDNIMIWAGFLGLTQVVSKQFERLYPNYTQETVYRGNSIFLTSHLASNVSEAKIAAARSSGSGGSSSIGGGGGSFGGGSGGGTR